MELDKLVTAERKVNYLRGKSLGVPLDPEEFEWLFEYIWKLEEALDEADMEDALGPSGWRHHVLGE